MKFIIASTAIVYGFDLARRSDDAMAIDSRRLMRASRMAVRVQHADVNPAQFAEGARQIYDATDLRLVSGAFNCGGRQGTHLNHLAAIQAGGTPLVRETILPRFKAPESASSLNEQFAGLGVHHDLRRNVGYLATSIADLANDTRQHGSHPDVQGTAVLLVDVFEYSTTVKMLSEDGYAVGGGVMVDLSIGAAGVDPWPSKLCAMNPNEHRRREMVVCDLHMQIMGAVMRLTDSQDVYQEIQKYQRGEA